MCCVSDDCGAQGMERNIGDQLNKAFEAYRQVSIEKDIAKKELQKVVMMKSNFLKTLCRMDQELTIYHNTSQSKLHC